MQRLLVAWAVLNHPDVLLFDEPTAAVDIGFTENIHAVMRRLTEERGTTILLISHDLNVVFRYAANVLASTGSYFAMDLPHSANAAGTEEAIW